MAIDIIRMVSKLKYTDATGIIRKQLIRSSTSVAANYRAVCRARSVKERFSKLCIVVEEADEVLFWLEILQETDLATTEQIRDIRVNSLEILKVMSAYKHKLKQSF